MMNQEKISTPITFHILMAVCLLIAGYMIVTFIRRLDFPINMTQHLVRIGLWLVVCLGFFKRKRWAWITFSVLLLFSVSSLLHAMLSLRMRLGLYPISSIFVGIILLWLLNTANIRTLFKADVYKLNQHMPELTTFSLFCLALALLILFELAGASRVAGSSIPAKLFLYALAVTYFLLGIGLLKLSQYALKAAPSLLIFTLIAVLIILIYDFFESNRFAAVNRSLFYIATSGGMLFYWIKKVRPTLKREDLYAAS